MTESRLARLRSTKSKMILQIQHRKMESFYNSFQSHAKDFRMAELAGKIEIRLMDHYKEKGRLQDAAISYESAACLFKDASFFLASVLKQREKA